MQDVRTGFRPFHPPHDLDRDRGVPGARVLQAAPSQHGRPGDVPRERLDPQRRLPRDPPERVMIISSVRGMKDLLPPESERWSALESSFLAKASSYGFLQLRTPIL